jgi:CRP-like cAMP-binding protein
MSLLRFTDDLPRRACPAGEVVVTQGTPPGALYILEDGVVRVERDGEPVARVAAPGAVFGEMSYVLDQPTTATVVCEQPSVFRVAEDAGAFLSAHPGAAVEIVRVTARRLDALTRYLVDLRQQYADRGDHLAMIGTVLDALAHQQEPAARPGSVRDPEG